ncbi:MAG TPA: DUF2141 domain-containing protein [Allosphingosinicella sp.]|nr:DUF2141 domain-containing protein [Allosphingosinicella sp.]
MLKLVLFSATAVLVALGMAAPADAALGPDAAACSPGARRPALLVSVNGFKNRVGRIRVQLYNNNPADFLAKGKKLKRIELSVTRAGAMNVCVAVPKPGVYAISVHHDADNDGRRGWNDGGGFSGNPHLTMLKLKPSLRQTAVAVGPGMKTVPVILNYRSGFSIAPINQ